MITAMMTKKARIGQRLALSALVFAALAAGTLLTGCEQTASSSPTRKGQLTVNGTPAGVYVASIYKPMEGLADITQGSEWNTGLWAKATDSSLLVASGVVTADGGKAVIPLSTPAGGDFTGDRAFLAVISPASPHEPPELKHYSITDFTAGRAAVNWKKSDGYTSEVYTITFHIDGSSFHLEVPLRGKVLEPEPDEHPPTGYALDGWYTDAGYTEKYNFDDEKTNKVNGNLDLYARWLPSDSLHTVTFDLNYEGAPDAPAPQKNIPNGSTATCPADPERTGWVFGGWYEDEDCETTPWDFSKPVTSDLYLYAKWTPSFFYTVTFDTDGVEPTPAPQSIPHGGRAEAPTETKPGYALDGWYTSPDYNYTTKWDFSTDTVTGNLTLYGTWTDACYTVTFYLNDGTNEEYGTQPVADGITATRPADPKRTEWVFGGWYKDKECKNPWDFTKPVNSDLKLYAKWTKKIYTVTFRSNYGSDEEYSAFRQTVEHGGQVEKPDPDPERTGYTLDGWYPQANGGKDYNFNTLVTGGLTLYARWKINTYNVTFDLNGATGTAPTHSAVPHGGTITKPSNPMRLGYKFDGWYTSPDYNYTTEWNFSTYTVTEPITLYAKWTQNTYSVSFHLNYGGATGTPDPQTIAHDGKVTPPADPERTGYAFGGWFTNADGTEEAWDFSTDAVTEPITLYAKWIKCCRVSFHVNDVDTVVYWVYVSPGGTVTAPTDLGYEVNGWYEDEDCETTPWDFSKPVTIDLDLYAKRLSLNTFANAIEYMEYDKGSATKTYTLPSGNEEFMDIVTLTAGTADANSPAFVTINGSGRTVTGSSNSITVGSGVKLTLMNITFKTLPFTVSAGGTLVLDNGAVIRDNAETGVTVSGGTLEMKDGASINGNNGAGITVAGGTLTMNGSALIYGNNGAGVIVSAGTFNMNGGTISANMGNAGQYQYGGGVRVNGNGAVFNMSGGLISGNTAQAYNGYINSHAGGGGGVYVSGSGAEFNMSGGLISGNTTKAWVFNGEMYEGGEGGGVFIEGKYGYAKRPLFNMTGGTIKNNTTIDVSASSLIDNGYAGVGGGVSVYWADFKMSGQTTEISENKTGAGGGVCLGDNSNFTMTGGSITKNVADEYPAYGNSFAAGGYGGGVCIAFGSFTMSGGEISGNEAEYIGGGVYQGEGTLDGNPPGNLPQIGGTTSPGAGRGWIHGNKLMNGQPSDVYPSN